MQLATVVVGARGPKSNPHHRRRILDGELVEEHQLQHLALAGAKHPECVPDAGATLLGFERLQRPCASLVPAGLPPMRKVFEPAAPPPVCSDVPDDREEPGFERGPTAETCTTFQHPKVG